ncbi:anhydro-N-acetylmuramic acid kinase [Microcoleus sp. FACHB-1515]|uniref:anhydro-N-acetylmuramic acid kinase n=1 Tax=Cyanophyceae TaxID=3028117 RepID=UPI001689BEC1|nr:anhydro-N-acetylmuramic acid kinase [Microcoleus sp. FACHB-1515]MBD2089209.1 anhydro-N-acetylmuramic acid kinase [Microcoleus sp. FACHB-1515]
MRVIGLISGTSVDGIDAALVEISGTTHDLQAQLIAAQTYPYPADLRDRILAVAGGASLSLADFAALDDEIAAVFAEAAIALAANQPSVDLIGSHGQTVFHHPRSSDHSLAYSVQLGRGAAIARLTQIPTVSNFRAADIAVGGEGAPMVSPVDACLLTHPTLDRAVQNIGGIGNVTYLPADRSQVLGWDTGPGNSLLDLAVQQLSDGTQRYDRDGAWAASGQPDLELVDRWLGHDFFQAPPPKSTGRELFGADYLRDRLAEAHDLDSADILATLTELTAASIAHSYENFLPRLPDQVLLCGGGSHNRYLRSRLQARFQATVLTTDEAGLNADFKEAIAFAVLAYWHQLGIPGNLPEVTGAAKAMILGESYIPSRQFSR